MQACSDLHVAHVGVRRVIAVHVGHDEVLVVVLKSVAIFVRDLHY